MCVLFIAGTALGVSKHFCHIWYTSRFLIQLDLLYNVIKWTIQVRVVKFSRAWEFSMHIIAGTREVVTSMNERREKCNFTVSPHGNEGKH